MPHDDGSEPMAGSLPKMPPRLTWLAVIVMLLPSIDLEGGKSCAANDFVP